MTAIQLPAPHLIQNERDAIRGAWSAKELQRRAENARRRQAELVALLEQHTRRDAVAIGAR